MYVSFIWAGIIMCGFAQNVKRCLKTWSCVWVHASLQTGKASTDNSKFSFMAQHAFERAGLFN
jgi:hypothetical protein